MDVINPRSFRIMFSCGACKTAFPLRALETKRRLNGTDIYGNNKIVRSYTLQDVPAGWLTRANVDEPCGAIVSCPKCGEHRVWGKPMNVTHAPHVRCDARCEFAKGPNCSCSCGGEHHGQGGFVALRSSTEVAS